MRTIQESIWHIFLNLGKLKIKHEFIFLFLIITYFGLGIYLINTTSLTGDEPAYLGAAYAYTKGQGLNQEHPLLLKLINSVLIQFFFNEHNIEVPNPQTLDAISIRLVPFSLGYSFLMSNQDKFDTILFASRFAYLTFNSILLFWLYIYTYKLKLIKPIFSISLAIIYIFSPSFYAHNFLTTFDVASAICALLTILSLTIIVRNFSSFKIREYLAHFLLFTILLCFSLNVKFSNFILVPIVIIAYLVTIIYFLSISKHQLAVKLSLFSTVSLLIQPLLIAIMYRIAFSKLPNQGIIDNLNRYYQGLLITLGAKYNVQQPFLYGKFVPITYIEYIRNIFWFRENPGLFLIFMVIILSSIFIFLTNKTKLRRQFKNLNIRIVLPSIALLFLVSIYPVIYFYLASNSRFVLGYRYFYPVLIFIYALVAIFIASIRNKIQQICLIFSLIVYIIFGVIGIPQSLSYVNYLWTEEKWKLTHDINWGQETKYTVQYLLDNNLLPSKNDNIIIHGLDVVVLNFTEYLSIMTRDKNNFDIGSYYTRFSFDENSKIQDLDYKYLVVDSIFKQRLSAKSTTNSIAAQNFKFIEKTNPIYSRNGIIFIYQLK
ncbi:MAG: hypothetical protein F6K10_40375 [Moorea sp. SIO2B7]|nr:hypothetical protein [Moorena sp. SIO2B7]